MAGDEDVTRPNPWFDYYEVETHPDGSFVELGTGAMGGDLQSVGYDLTVPGRVKSDSTACRGSTDRTRTISPRGTRRGQIAPP